MERFSHRLVEIIPAETPKAAGVADHTRTRLPHRIEERWHTRTNATPVRCADGVIAPVKSDPYEGKRVRHDGRGARLMPMTAAFQRPVGAFRRLVRAMDAFQQRRVWLAFPFAVIRKMSNDRSGVLAGLIAYYGFLAVFPLLLVFAAVLGFVLAGDPALAAQVLRTAENSFPALAGYLSKTVSGSDTALGIGLAAAVWAGLGVTRATERAMNNIWDIPLAERPNPWWSRLRGLFMLCVLGVTFLISTALAALRGQGGLAGVGDVVGVVGPLALNLALYLLAFQVLTNRRLAWSALLPGATVGAVGWVALQSLGAFYVRHEVAHASRLYGSLAVVVGLMAWIYLGAQLTLFAAEINVVRTYRLWPRSLNGAVTTEADRRAFARQAKEAARNEGELVTVSFADTASSPDVTASPNRASGPDILVVPAGQLSARAVGTHESVVSLRAHLLALDQCRQRLDAATRVDQRRSLARRLAAETNQTVDAFGRLLDHETELGAALGRGST